MTAAERAETASAQIEQLHGNYLAAVRALGDSNDPEATVRLPLIRAAWDCSMALNNAIERAIVQTDILKLHQSEVWARDLAASAYNVLESIPKFYAKMQKEYAGVGQPCPKASSLAFHLMQGVVTIYHPNDADKIRQAFIDALLPTSGFDRPLNMSRFSTAERITAIITGIVLVIVMLCVALFFRDYNNFNLWLFRILVALAAGILGGTLVPGVFSVTQSTAKGVVRATGGCAFFFLVYYVNPPALVVQDIQPVTHSQTK